MDGCPKQITASQQFSAKTSFRERAVWRRGERVLRGSKPVDTSASIHGLAYIYIYIRGFL